MDCSTHNPALAGFQAGSFENCQRGLGGSLETSIPRRGAAVEHHPTPRRCESPVMVYFVISVGGGFGNK